MGNVVPTVRRRGINSDRRSVTFDAASSGTYATGGETFNAAALATIFNGEGYAIADVVEFRSEPNLSGFYGHLDKTNSKLLIFDAGGQIANATDWDAAATGQIRCTFVYGSAGGG